MDLFQHKALISFDYEAYEEALVGKNEGIHFGPIHFTPAFSVFTI